MHELFDVWVSLGEYDLEPGKEPMSGRVRQFDLSLEDPPVEISFSPVRWVPMIPLPAGATRFDAPIGVQAERDGPFVSSGLAFGMYPIWVGKWYDANPFLTWYSQGYHTGADLNLPGSSDADKDAPIYAVADGRVRFAGPAGSWGNIVVMEHPSALVTLPDGHQQHQRVFSRYGHVSDRILVSAGQEVARGTNIAFVGLQAHFVTGWHLHFDVSYSDMFVNRPAHWPNMTQIRSLQQAKVSPNKPEFLKAQAAVKQEVIAHYLEPLRFLKDNHG
jgi:murein DD-endopeptidase MepM/ murein hydrolase activator NlpD